MIGAISDAESNLTLFAPVDEGFIGLFDDLGVASVSDIDVDTLADVLLNHLVEGARFESDILSGTFESFGIFVFENGSGVSPAIAFFIRFGLGFGALTVLSILEIFECSVCFDSPGPNSEQALGGGTLRFEVEHLYDEVNIEVESLGASGPASAEFIKPDIVAGNSVIHIVTNPLFHDAVPGARGRKGTN